MRFLPSWRRIDGIPFYLYRPFQEELQIVDRKARTKRLIERGAILESLISGADVFTNEQIKAFLEKTITRDAARKILDRIAKQGEIVTPSKLANVQSKDEFLPIVKSASTASGEG